jgi:hypothetical protein
VQPLWRRTYVDEPDFQSMRFVWFKSTKLYYWRRCLKYSVGTDCIKCVV